MVTKNLLINSPVQKVASLLEDPTRVSEWNMLVKSSTPGANNGRGLGSTLEWKSNIQGIPIDGKSNVVTWKPNKEYAWKNTERVTGLSTLSDFTLTPTGPRGGQTMLTATVSFLFPNDASSAVRKVGGDPQQVMNLLTPPGAKSFLNGQVESALHRINGIVQRMP